MPISFQFLIFLVLPAIGPALFGADPPIRFAMSDRIVRGVNLNDARAAIALWGKDVIRHAGLQVVDQQDWVRPSAAVLAGLRAGAIDVVCISVEEFLEVPDTVEVSEVVVDDRRGNEMVLIVRKDSNYNSLASLRGHPLLMLDNPDMLLGESWLASELRRAGLPDAAHHFSSITRLARPSQVVLPIFFGRADAAVVTREAFQTMVEMNPQLGVSIRQVLVSERLVTTFLATRRGLPTPIRNRIIEGILASKFDPAIRQVLTLFHVRGYMRCPQACILPSVALIEGRSRSPKL